MNITSESCFIEVESIASFEDLVNAARIFTRHEIAGDIYPSENSGLFRRIVIVCNRADRALEYIASLDMKKMKHGFGEGTEAFRVATFRQLPSKEQLDRASKDPFKAAWIMNNCLETRSFEIPDLVNIRKKRAGIFGPLAPGPF